VSIGLHPLFLVILAGTTGRNSQILGEIPKKEGRVPETRKSEGAAVPSQERGATVGMGSGGKDA
jgi:hypothetical protein